MNINRSGFYKRLKRRANPSIREINRNSVCNLFEEYHDKFPSHGYHAKIKLDLGIAYSDSYSHKICKFLDIKSHFS